MEYNQESVKKLLITFNPSDKCLFTVKNKKILERLYIRTLPVDYIVQSLLLILNMLLRVAAYDADSNKGFYDLMSQN